MNHQLVYLASPYSHPHPAMRIKRFEAACKATAILMNKGHIVFSPIAHTHPICLHGQLPSGWDFWHRYDYVMLEKSSILAVLPLPGWKESKGIKGEFSIWLSELKRELSTLVVVDNNYVFQPLQLDL